MKQKDFDARVNSFFHLTSRLINTMQSPFTLEEVVGMYEASIPAEFHQAADVLMAVYGYHPDSFDTNELILLCPIAGTGELFQLRATKSHNLRGAEKRPRTGVLLKGTHEDISAMGAYVKELYDVTRKVSAARDSFTRMTRASNTPAEVFYAMPLFKQYAARQSEFADTKFPKGRRPKYYDPGMYEQDQLMQVNETLLAALLCVDANSNPLSYRASVSMVIAKKEGAEAPVV